ncbi:MAG: hypothetical protein NXI16_09715 [Alphaproteobacteria bacterium]|nr:hypothetical protein [Alphaproteobacteria bacterium]
MSVSCHIVRAVEPDGLADRVLAVAPDAQRIAVCGCSGSGKSTLARGLCARTGLPFFSIDALYWRPGWGEPDPDRFLGTFRAAAAEPRWVMDGNYVTLFPDRFAGADLVILFDLPPLLCLTRAARRIAGSYGAVRPEMAPGCPERIDWAFFRYILRFRRDSLPRLQAAIEDHADCPVVRVVR